MASNVSDEALPPELLDSVQEFNSLIDEVDNVLNQLIDNEFASQVDKLERLDQVKAYLVVTYAMNSLFWMYLSTQGIAPKDHPVKQELDRIRKYMNKAQALYDKRKAMKVDKNAASRFIKNALHEPTKIDESKSNNNVKTSRKLHKAHKKAKKRKMDDSRS